LEKYFYFLDICLTQSSIVVRKNLRRYTMAVNWDAARAKREAAQAIDGYAEQVKPTLTAAAQKGIESTVHAGCHAAQTKVQAQFPCLPQSATTASVQSVAAASLRHTTPSVGPAVSQSLEGTKKAAKAGVGASIDSVS
jgi:hypothetical protein